MPQFYAHISLHQFLLVLAVGPLGNALLAAALLARPAAYLRRRNAMIVFLRIVRCFVSTHIFAPRWHLVLPALEPLGASSSSTMRVRLLMKVRRPARDRGRCGRAARSGALRR